MSFKIFISAGLNLSDHLPKLYLNKVVMYIFHFVSFMGEKDKMLKKVAMDHLILYSIRVLFKQL